VPLFKSTDGWNRSELDPYFKTSNGLEVRLGYDGSRSWTANYLQYSSKHHGVFRVGQFLTRLAGSNSIARAGLELGFLHGPLSCRVNTWKCRHTARMGC